MLAVCWLECIFCGYLGSLPVFSTILFPPFDNMTNQMIRIKKVNVSNFDLLIPTCCWFLVPPHQGHSNTSANNTCGQSAEGANATCSCHVWPCPRCPNERLFF